MKLGLGTAQFGMDYGISNRDGRTPLQEVAAILRFAREKGIHLLDTASAYGLSETALGETLGDDPCFRIISKTPHFPPAVLGEPEARRLEEALHGSLRALKRSRVTGLLVHDADDLLKAGGDLLYAALLRLKAEGLVEKAGVSVYRGEQIDALLDRYDLDLVQLPLSLLDQRLLWSGHLERLRQRGVEVHARSLFLQGLLLMAPEDLPPFFAPLRGHLRLLHDFLARQRWTAVAAAFHFIRQVPQVDCAIIGVNNLEQLKANVAAFEGMDGGGPGLATLKAFAIGDPLYVDPSRWRLS